MVTGRGTEKKDLTHPYKTRTPGRSLNIASQGKTLVSPYSYITSPKIGIKRPGDFQNVNRSLQTITKILLLSLKARNL